MSGAGIQQRRRGRPPGSDGARTRALIIAAAREGFSGAGYSLTTRATIAARIGHSAATVGTYFPSKHALYAEVVACTTAEVIAVGTAAAARADTLGEQLAAFLEAVMDLHSRHPSVTTFFSISLIDTYRRPEFMPNTEVPHTRIEKLLSRAVDAAVARGELDPEVDTIGLVETIRVAVFGICVHLARHREGGSINPALTAGLQELISAVVSGFASPVHDLVSP